MEHELALKGLIGRWDRLTPEQRQARMASIELARAVRRGPTVPGGVDDIMDAMQEAIAACADVVRRANKRR